MHTYAEREAILFMKAHIFGDAQQIPVSVLSRWVYIRKIYYTPTWPFIPLILPSLEILVPVQSFSYYSNCLDCLTLH